MKKLTVHSGKRYFMWDDGTPFFYLGDTAWELFHKLTKEEIQRYLNIRKKQGFNVIQAVALSEMDGLTTPNAYGRFPLLKKDGYYDPTSPDEDDAGYDYWQHVDYAIRMAAESDIFIGLLPTWGDKYNLKQGTGPKIFNKYNAYLYGKWIAGRYKNHWNIIWILGGDRPLENKEHEKIIDEMARGIREVDQNHLITFHPSGAHSSVEFVADKDYIDFHMIQSGHALEAYDSYLMLRNTAQKENKPYMDGEPRYEDHPACFKTEMGYFWKADDIRHNAYWNIMEGACGHTYGNHSIWSFNTQRKEYWPYTWKEVLEHEGANEVQYVKKLRLSRNYFDFHPAPELIADNAKGLAYQCAGKGSDYAFIYTPLGLPINANIEQMGSDMIKASWFNPRTGEEQVYKILPAKNTCFVPPSYGPGNDWVLILDCMNI